MMKNWKLGLASLCFASLALGAGLSGVANAQEESDAEAAETTNVKTESVADPIKTRLINPINRILTAPKQVLERERIESLRNKKGDDSEEAEDDNEEATDDDNEKETLKATGAIRARILNAKSGERKENAVELKARSIASSTLDRVEDLRLKREEALKRAEEARQKAAEKREEIRQKLAEEAAKRVQAFAERTLERFEAALERLSKLSERIGSRILKLEENGLNLDRASSLLEEANVKIDEAETSVLEAGELAGDVITSENPKEMFAGMRDALNTAKEAIKDAHSALVDSISAIKASLPAPTGTSGPAPTAAPETNSDSADDNSGADSQN